MVCPNCGKEIVQTEGKREKKFCNSTCRSNIWQKQKRNQNHSEKTEVKKESQVSAELKWCEKCKQVTQHLNDKCKKCEIPPMPIREKGEDVFDFAARKNAWKAKYNQH